MQIWAGLGNPGAQYAMHRHNVGFMVADAIAEVHGFGAVKKQFQGWTQEGRIGSTKILLLKPATFMNESGRAIGEAPRSIRGRLSTASLRAGAKLTLTVAAPVPSGAGLALMRRPFIAWNTMPATSTTSPRAMIGFLYVPMTAL